MRAGRVGQDAFLLLTLALEARARALGALPAEPRPAWVARNAKLLGAAGATAERAFAATAPVEGARG